MKFINSYPKNIILSLFFITSTTYIFSWGNNNFYDGRYDCDPEFNIKKPRYPKTPNHHPDYPTQAPDNRPNYPKRFPQDPNIHTLPYYPENKFTPAPMPYCPKNIYGLNNK